MALTLLPAPAVAQGASEYRVGPSPALPDSLHEYREGFTIQVQRRVSSDFEQELLAIAEGLYPPSALIERTETEWLESNNFGRWPQILAEAQREAGPRWWWHDWGPTRLPYALNGAAVDFQISAMRALSRAPRHRGPAESDPPPTGSFTYLATVAPQGNDRFVVDLEAKWAYHCGSLCGLWFTKTRRVVFDSQGNVQAVEGDGIPEWLVS